METTLNELNPWWNKDFILDTDLIYRDIFDEVNNSLSQNDFVLISGMDDFGKTTTLNFVAFELIKNLHIQPQRVLFVDFKQSVPLNYIMTHIESNSPYKTYLLADNIGDDNKDFTKIVDKYGSLLKVVATKNSNDRFLGTTNYKNFVEYDLPLVSFTEYLRYKRIINTGQQLKEIALENIVKSPLIKPLFWNYLIYGSYPYVLKTDDLNLKQTFLMNKTQRSKLDEDIYKNIYRYLALKTGNLLNICDLADSLSVSRYHAEKHLALIEEENKVSFLPSLDIDIKKALKKSLKIFFHDLGVRNAFINGFQNINERFDVENLVLNYAVLFFYHTFPKMEISFFRTTNQTEINLVLQDESGLIPIQICYDKPSEKIPRIFRFFKDSVKKRISKFIVITKDIYKKEQLDDTDVLFIPSEILPFFDKIN